MNAPSKLLATRIGSLVMDSPVMLAAGTAGTLDEMGDVLDWRDVGAVVTKSITDHPRQGNPTWRILESRVGMLNAIGLANIGIDAFIEREVPRIRALPTPVVVSIAGWSIEDYESVSTRLARYAEVIPAIELNVSCPNVHGGTEFGADPGALRELVAEVRTVTEQTLIVKLSPITIGTPRTISDVALAAIGGGADALTIANTIPAMEIDVETRMPRLANTTGGLSGPAVHPIAVKLVHDVFRNVARDAHTPLIGLGGVSSWKDAAEFVLAGASAVQIGTASFANPRTSKRVVAGLEKWVRRQQASNIAELVGAMRPPGPPVPPGSATTPSQGAQP